MKILVTGATGQLGRELNKKFQDEGMTELIFLDRDSMPLDDIANIRPTLQTLSPDLIIHTAAYTAVDHAEDERELVNRVNHLAAVEIAKFCFDNSCKLIFISTDYVFEGIHDKPLAENEPTNPINNYGRSKLMAELGILDVLPNAIIIRTSWVYSEFGNNFVKTMIRLMREKDSINVVNDQFGSPTYAADLASAIVAIIETANWESGVYHYSNEGVTSWYDFALEIKNFCGFDCTVNPIPSNQFTTNAARPMYSVLDKTKIKSVYKLDVPEWQSSLHRMLKNFRT